jgi:hypothetical protein
MGLSVGRPRPALWLIEERSLLLSDSQVFMACRRRVHPFAVATHNHQRMFPTSSKASSQWSRMATSTLHGACGMCETNWRTARETWGCHVQEVRWTRQGGKGKGRRGGQIGDGRGMEGTQGATTMTRGCFLT